ncbi:MAG: hypothetical protein KIH67_003415 [Candidatus Moranbacteria bacterium]|nr:hypothetical protein [Candidatus Moranbacteria bacterium]
MSIDSDFVSWRGVLTPRLSINLSGFRSELTLHEEIATRYNRGQIDVSYTTSGVFAVFQERLDGEDQEFFEEVMPYDVGLSAHQPRNDPRIRYVRAPSPERPSHYELLSYLGEAAFISWRTMFALIDADVASQGEIFGLHGPIVGLYLRTKNGWIMKVTVMRGEADKGPIYYFDNPMAPNVARAGVLHLGTRTIFAVER